MPISLVTPHEAARSSANNKVTSVRKNLSLSIPELASSMNSTRDRTYDWIKSNLPIASLDGRLDTVYSISVGWEARKIGPVGRYRNLRMGDPEVSLVALLGQDIIDMEKVTHALDLIEKKMRADGRKKIDNN